ncbi:magnesium and cobalt transport protein CorA [Echinicola strongylocentroti]|uniref:Magnesium transport protein CorA n=1 Tax=Echinicola strongylocentroti TaxID=1795355 RepID=A0A2Z4IM35_9BACT|nr:magnesium/cobalt transporter CorA [Echinicola strongylocentroti]AWW31770.1 magnesium and cobalt transport protein CorA [Echinicola strongylocentroti]
MSKTNDPSRKPSSLPLLELYSFGEQHFEKHLIHRLEDLKSFLEKKELKFWLNVPSIDDHQLIQDIAAIFSIHPLVIEDLTTTSQRPKIEEFEDHIFVVLKMLYSKNSLAEIQDEQVSILFGNNYILSFQETPQDIFDNVRIRLESPKAKMRKLGTDYFTYALVDAIVDEYYGILELVSDAVEKCDDMIMKNKSNVNLNTIHHQRKIVRKIRNNIWPIRELISVWKKSEHPLIKRKNITYINDIYEHSIEILEGLELQRETMSSLAELYMTQLSIKQNEVMKTLTVISTIFIPLTFIAGIYGMNFKVMPELEWKYSYPVLWLVFIFITYLMIRYFKRKKWF